MLHKEQAFKRLCDMSFSFYCKQFLKVVEPETNFEWNWHLDIFCKTCEDVYCGKIQNIDIQVPPRTLKSIIFNVLFPTWIWTKEPSYKILSASSSYELANKYNRQRREVISSEAYQFFWPIQLKDDANTMRMFANTNNGFMRSVSSLGKVTGEGADLLLSDDLIDAKDAFSKLKRESIRHWYEFVFFGRAQNRNTVKRININQRLHPKDISDLTVNHFGFPSLVIQMLKTNKNLGTIEYEDPRQEGEFLFPNRYGQKEMDEDRKNTNKWSSQYQQEPMAQTGGIIKEEWLRYYETPPAFDKIVIVGDLNFKPSQDSDFAAFACWGRHGPNKYLIDMVRGRWTYAQTKSIFESFTNKHGNANNIYIEGKANGQALLSDFAGKVKGMQEWPFNNPQLSRASKVERLYMVSQEFEQGNVYLPTNLSIMEPYLEELLSFSENGSATGHDDMVDTTSMALIELKKKKSFIG